MQEASKVFGFFTPRLHAKMTYALIIKRAKYNIGLTINISESDIQKPTIAILSAIHGFAFPK